MQEEKSHLGIRRLDPGLSRPEWLRALTVSTVLFAVFGTVTALWSNELFIRMTPTGPWDWAILALESGLLGLYVGTRTPACRVGQAGAGGVLGFLGFGCALCNKLLLLVFGAGFLMTYFEPIRTPLGLLGIAILFLAVKSKLNLRHSLAASPSAGAGAG